MKTTIFLFAAGAVTVFAQDELIPKAYPKERYASMAEKSPFVVATPPEVKVEEAPDPFANYYLKGVTTDYVVIQKVGEDSAIRLYGNAPDKGSGFALKKIHWGNGAKRTEVDVVKDGVEGKLQFSENDFKPAPPPVAPAGNPNMRRTPLGAAPIMNPAAAGQAIPRPQNTPSVPLPQVQRPTINLAPPPANTGGRGPAGFRTGGTTQPTNDFNGSRRRDRGGQINNR